MIDESTVHKKAREVIKAGKLPDRRPDRTWGGPGLGACCTICGAPVKQDEVELEVEFARDDDDAGPDNYHVHVRCFSAWEIERQNLEPHRGIPMQSALPASRSGGRPEAKPDSTGNRGALPESMDVGKNAGDERPTAFKRGPT